MQIPDTGHLRWLRAEQRRKLERVAETRTVGRALDASLTFEEKILAAERPSAA